MSYDELLPRITRVIHLMAKQLTKLTTRDLMSFLKSDSFGLFLKTLAALESEHKVEHTFFKEYLDELMEWQDLLAGGIINVTRDFTKVYVRADSLERVEMKEKIIVHQSKRTKDTLNEFFRLLDAAVASKKLLPLEAFAQHLGLTLNELVVHLERINWSDLQPREPETKDEVSKFTLPIQIEKDFFNYYHHMSRLIQLDIQDITTRGISSSDQPKLKAFYQWLDKSNPDETVDFEEMIQKAGLQPQKLVQYLERINWSQA